MSSYIPTGTHFVKSAVVLLAVATVFYGLAQYLLRGLEADAAEFPVHLHEGGKFSADFEAKWAVDYEIRLDSERNLDLQRQNCLLGIETTVPERCAGMAPELLLSWRVETDNTFVASGDSNDSNKGYWDLKMGKVLGSFPATKGEIYRVWNPDRRVLCNTATDQPENKNKNQIRGPEMDLRLDRYADSGCRILLFTCAVVAPDLPGPHRQSSP